MMADSAFNNAMAGCFTVGGTSAVIITPRCLVASYTNDFGFKNGYLDATSGMQLPLSFLGQVFPRGQQLFRLLQHTASGELQHSHPSVELRQQVWPVLQ